MKSQPLASDKDDIRYLDKAISTLMRPYLMVRVVVLLLTIVIWLLLSSLILNIGENIDYAFFQHLSPQFVDYLNSINKYIWWGLVLIFTLAVYFIASAWLYNQIERAGQTKASMHVLRPLLQNLSPTACDVLAWVWHNRRKGITIKNLIDTRQGIKHHLIEEITLIREQASLLTIDHTIITPTVIHAENDTIMA